MKKIVSVFISVLMLSALFTGCIAPQDSQSSAEERSTAPKHTSRPPPKPAYQPVYAHNANQPIKWKDENFKHLIYDAMGWDYATEVCPLDFSNVKTLFILSDQAILINQSPMWDLEPEENGTDYIWNGVTYTESVSMNLDDLINFISLEELKVCLVDVETINFLPYIHHLKYLWMSGCKIDDISVLPKCTNVRELRMPGNNISDISPVVGMDLWDLFLPHNNITDISPLAEMAKLPDELVLSFNNISDISAIAPAGRADTLAYLNLRNNNISDISALDDYTGIGILSLSYNNIADFSPIDDLPYTNTIYRIGNPAA